YPARYLYESLVSSRLLLQVRRCAFGEMAVRGVEVDAREEVLVHVVVVRAGVVRFQSHVLVQVEGLDVGEIYGARHMKVRQFRVDAFHGAARRAAEHEIGFGSDAVGDDTSCEPFCSLRVGKDEYLHAPIVAASRACLGYRSRKPSLLSGAALMAACSSRACWSASSASSGSRVASASLTLRSSENNSMANAWSRPFCVACSRRSAGRLRSWAVW